MISISGFKRNISAVLGMNLAALNSTQPSAAFVIMSTRPLFFERLRSLKAYLSISSILFDIPGGIGSPIG